ncbi:MAG: acyltransferase [Xanthomonadales bacterium]|jgi:peptidoglycan/LPS O-acetylase OafA/YrhL|nr:acyltransferase [Xanthomonadales bacterium]
MKQELQTLRGIACVLLVLYHVIGADPSVGLRVAEGWLRVGNDGLAWLRMPLFTVLSGLVYGLRPYAGEPGRFLAGKARRLLVPMLVVGTAFALVQAAVPGTNAPVTNWWLLHIEPVGHFWFLESLCWIFLLLVGLESARMLSTPGRFAGVFAAACALYLTVDGPRLFGIQGAIYLLPSFLAGLAVTRFGFWNVLTRPGVIAVGLVVAVLAVWWIGMPEPNPDRRTPAVLLAGLSLCALMLALRWPNRWLGTVGNASYAIYLYHVFFTAGARIVAERFGLGGQLPLLIALGVTAGVLGPLLLERAILRLSGDWRWPPLLLLGRSGRARDEA